MGLSKISGSRLYRQLISNPSMKSAAEVVSWMCAMQAQDYKMVKWALGLRMTDSSESAIDRDIDAGKIIRTHLLRPTWHFASSDDIYWLLDLSVPHIKACLSYRDKQLELTDSVFRKSNAIIEKALIGNNHKTRDELMELLAKSKIQLDNNRASHIFTRAEMDRLICSGKQKKGKPTFALLNEWVPQKLSLSREEALTRLGLKYFRSRGPATINDFAWWSGLSAKDSRIALENNMPQLICETYNSEKYWLTHSEHKVERNPVNIHFLPAFDEYLISYRNRNEAIGKEDHKKAVSNNGIFYPVIVSHGLVTGTWSRITKKDRIEISIKAFEQGSKYETAQAEKSLKRYTKFIDKPLEIKIL